MAGRRPKPSHLKVVTGNPGRHPRKHTVNVLPGGKVAFDLRGGEVVVTRADADHEDPAIGAFLGLLEADIRAGRHVQSLPDDLARAMLANAHHAVNLDEDIEGEVAL